MSAIHPTSNDDITWCWSQAPANNLTINAVSLYEEAQVLSSYDHLAAVFCVAPEELTKYKPIIERARKIGEHEFLRKLQERVYQNDREAMRIYADMLKLFEMDKSAPITEEEQMTPEKASAVLRGNTHGV